MNVAQTTLTPDVLIVGGGIAGCPLAVALKKQGYDVVLVERAQGPRRIFKGEYLQPGATEFLKKLGFSKVFSSPSSSQITRLRFRDVDHKAQVTSSLTMRYPKGMSGISIEYVELIGGFLGLVQEHLGESLWQGAELRPINQNDSHFLSQPIFLCTHAERGSVHIKPKWVIGCDGRQSTVRRWMGERSAEKNGSVVWGVKNEFIYGTQISELSREPGQCDLIRTPDDGTISQFSLGPSGQRIYFSTAPKGSNLSAHFVKVLKKTQASTGLQYLPEKIVIAGFPANTSWYGPAALGAFVLAGDALAVTTPFGGHGMTAAMEHVQFLTEHFSWRSRSPLEQDFMRSSYAIFAEEVHRRISFLNFGLYHTFFNRSLVMRRTSHLLLNRWNKNPALCDRITRLFGGIDKDMPTLIEMLDLRGIPMSETFSKFAQRNIQWG